MALCLKDNMKRRTLLVLLTLIMPETWTSDNQLRAMFSLVVENRYLGGRCSNPSVHCLLWRHSTRHWRRLSMKLFSLKVWQVIWTYKRAQWQSKCYLSCKESSISRKDKTYRSMLSSDSRLNQLQRSRSEKFTRECVWLPYKTSHGGKVQALLKFCLIWRLVENKCT